MYCRNCGTLLSDDAKFCRNCGCEISKGEQHSQTAIAQVDTNEKLNGGTIQHSGNIGVVDVDYEKMYQYAEQGVASHVFDRFYDAIFGAITKLKVVRVTGYQLALIFKKRFIDKCETEQDVKYYRFVQKTNLMGKKLLLGSIICFNRGRYRWIKDCNARIIWELKSDILSTECGAFKKSIRKILDEKIVEINSEKSKMARGVLEEGKNVL